MVTLHVPMSQLTRINKLTKFLEEFGVFGKHTHNLTTSYISGSSFSRKFLDMFCKQRSLQVRRNWAKSPQTNSFTKRLSYSTLPAAHSACQINHFMTLFLSCIHYFKKKPKEGWRYPHVTCTMLLTQEKVGKVKTCPPPGIEFSAVLICKKTCFVCSIQASIISKSCVSW